MLRDLTRETMRRLVRLGLEQTRGSYSLLVQLFNMHPSDYKRFLNLLRKYDCHLAFKPFRTFKPQPEETDPPAEGLAEKESLIPDR